LTSLEYKLFETDSPCLIDKTVERKSFDFGEIESMNKKEYEQIVDVDFSVQKEIISDKPVEENDCKTGENILGINNIESMDAEDGDSYDDYSDKNLDGDSDGLCRR
jgi:hypothetical protein